MAIRTLSLAEALTFYSDWKIMNDRTRKIDRFTDSSWLSPQGRLFLGLDAFAARLVPRLAKGPALQLLRRAMTPWADHLPKHPEEFLVRVREALAVIEFVDPWSGANRERAEKSLGGDPARLRSPR